jgi:hypothetical protein
MAGNAKVTSLDGALAWLDGVQRTGRVRTTGTWPLSSVLDHLAQSVEMSLEGFPLQRSALFQATAGRAAFAWFKSQGAMQHGLAEAIPGAPPLDIGSDWQAGARRLQLAIRRFSAHSGALRPHFAYGALSKDDFARAHVLHIANHQDEIVEAA